MYVCIYIRWHAGTNYISVSRFASLQHSILDGVSSFITLIHLTDCSHNMKTTILFLMRIVNCSLK